MLACNAKRRGMTLLEVLIVISIVTISIGSLSGLATLSMTAGVRAQRIHKATVLAQNELEYWRARGGAGALALGAGTHPLANPLAGKDDNRAATGTLEVRRIDDRLVEVTAHVALLDRPGNPVNVSLATWLETGGQ